MWFSLALIGFITVVAAGLIVYLVVVEQIIEDGFDE